MGGANTGFWRSRGAQQCEQMQSIDLAWLRRENSLNPGASGTLLWSRNGKETGSIEYMVLSVSLKVTYRSRGQDARWEYVEESLPFVWTDTRFDGLRRWFQCLSCGRRCRIVYGGPRFRCRMCHRLTYNSQYEPAWERPLTRARLVRMRLGGSASIEGPFPPKPKGMHWRTYERHFAKDQIAKGIWSRIVQGWHESGFSFARGQSHANVCSWQYDDAEVNSD